MLNSAFCAGFFATTTFVRPVGFALISFFFALKADLFIFSSSKRN
jgi:hypothetical protein